VADGRQISAAAGSRLGSPASGVDRRPAVIELLPLPTERATGHGQSIVPRAASGYWLASRADVIDTTVVGCRHPAYAHHAAVVPAEALADRRSALSVGFPIAASDVELTTRSRNSPAITSPKLPRLSISAGRTAYAPCVATSDVATPAREEWPRLG
jgi:hypothetical protein